jgi:ribulose-phosphate 3-epimerase
VAPSLLAADFSRLGQEIEAVETGGADLLHLDVMDGQFVDNITMGPVILRGIRKLTRLYLDTHLMVEEPRRYVQAFRDAGADGITVHVEATRDLDGTLRAVRDSGADVGLSLNPDTPLGPWLPYLDRIDLLLIMSVQPGFGGQAFQPEVLSKLKRAAEIRAENDYRFALEIDGGIDAETGREARRAGADVLVAGSAIFRHPPVAERIAALHRVGADLSA